LVILHLILEKGDKTIALGRGLKEWDFVLSVTEIHDSDDSVGQMISDLTKLCHGLTVQQAS
jgi:hypothetical protein